MPGQRETSRGRDLATLTIGHAGEEHGAWRNDWTCEKWEQDKVDHVLARLDSEQRFGDMIPHELGGKTIWRPRSDGLPSDFLREFGVEPDEITVIEGNLLVNEGIGRLLDLLCGAGGVAYNNANAFIGVGDTATAEAATQTELLAAANRFYKAMNATYPVSPGSNGPQSRDWRSDFTTTEANWAWQEWTIAAGATTASGAGFTNGTTNLNRKVQSLGTKSTGTWTMTSTVTIS
jgi:hypothetical protein